MARKKDSGGLGPLTEQAIKPNLLGRTELLVGPEDEAPAAPPDTARPPAGKMPAPRRAAKATNVPESPPVAPPKVSPTVPPAAPTPEPAVGDASSTPRPTLGQFLLRAGGAIRLDS